MAILSTPNGTKAPGLNFQLPDGETSVSIRAADDTDQDDGLQSYYVYAQGEHISSWVADQSATTRISPAMVLDERAEVDCIRQLKLVPTAVNGTNGISGEVHEHSAAVMIERTWISIYALWLKLQDQDVFAIAVPAEARHTQYLVATGLGVPSPFEQASAQADGSSLVLLLSREPFWQGAGAPDRFAWLRARPEASFPGINGHLGAFASQMSFTRKGNVCTTHPLRPPKPAPGTVLYSRFIVEMGQHLKLVHIDAQNPLHFDNYCKWQNSDRVNHGWRERGPDEKHRAYLESQRLDPHTMSLIFLWDDEPAGDSEVGWAKEDNTACFVNSNCNIHIGEFDQNSHMLVGEERFRGGKRYQAVATSIKHLCFLRDPRTQQVIAEPRHDLPSVPIQARFLPQERKKRFQLPHKTAVLFALQRDRFFSEGHFY
ncbi:Acyltransferase fer5 [Pseudocercospora fuligena]|uniref:Acyltransferase fer5 n=1 Tax=Pseudocercospora fuligena TaxID=685502 RepID=A0A8H6RRV5_9PEZI|nr:Acyltransferase fer5 [Pseudocercospora fuligena]